MRVSVRCELIVEDTVEDMCFFILCTTLCTMGVTMGCNIKGTPKGKESAQDWKGGWFRNSSGAVTSLVSYIIWLESELLLNFMVLQTVL